MIALLALLAQLVASQANKCEYKDHNHPVCIFKEPACKLISSGLKKQQRDEILQLHNELRQKVASGLEPGQPPASNMREMEYYRELERIAQVIAERCKFYYISRNVTVTEDFGFLGQNSAIMKSTVRDCEPDWTGRINVWFNKGKGLPHREIKSYTHTRGYSSYTQMVWADTYGVGCGWVCFKHDEWYTQLYACTYGPSGNYISEAVYKEGRPASKCPFETEKSEKYNALCSFVYGNN